MCKSLSKNKSKNASIFLNFPQIVCSKRCCKYFEFWKNSTFINIFIKFYKEISLSKALKIIFSIKFLSKITQAILVTFSFGKSKSILLKVKLKLFSISLKLISH